MYIIKIVLDGFKSYKTRTEISGFDPEFNAITGLNGHGKSNVLDSICFVLGISNLSQARVARRASAGREWGVRHVHQRRARCATSRAPSSERTISPPRPYLRPRCARRT